MIRAKVHNWSGIAALGGFLAGLTLLIASGIGVEIQSEWLLDSFSLSLAERSVLLGALVGAFLSGYLADKIGRRKTLIGIAALFLFGAIGTTVSSELYVFTISRFIGGFAAGAVTVVSPIYLAEISPVGSRGKTSATFQINFLGGMSTALFLIEILAGIGEFQWRIQLGTMLFPSLVFCGLVAKLPETPRWLFLERDDEEAVRTILEEIDPETIEDAISDYDLFQQYARFERTRNHQKSKSAILGIGLVIIFIIFHQVFILLGYFLHQEIVKVVQVGLQDPGYFLTVISLFIVFAGLFIGRTINDKYGRQKLVRLGAGMALACSVGMLLFSLTEDSAFSIATYLVFQGFTFGLAFSLYTVFWGVIIEMYPHSYEGQKLSAVMTLFWGIPVFWIVLVEEFELVFSSTISFAALLVFTGLLLLYAVFLMPETSGMSLEELAHNTTHQSSDQDKEVEIVL